jgi:transcriptional regulator with XRE-family HTH domain
MENIGTKIKKVRELRNYTQEHMAHKLSMSQVNYSRIERNEVKIKPEKLEEIANVLGVDVDALLSFDEKVVFNIMHNKATSNITYSGNINLYQIDSKIEKLYEDKISLMEEKIAMLSAELQKMKEQ